MLSFIKENFLKLKGQDPNTSKNNNNDINKQTDSSNSKKADDASFSSTEKNNKDSKGNTVPPKGNTVPPNDKKGLDPSPKQPNSNNPQPPKQHPSPSTTRPPKKKKPNFWLMALLFLLLFFLIWGLFFSDKTYVGDYKHLSDGLVNGQITDVSGYWYYGNYVRLFYVLDKKTYVVTFDGMQHLSDFWYNEVPWPGGTPTIAFPKISEYTGPGLITTMLVNFLPFILIMLVGFWMIKKLTERQSGVGKISKKSITPQMSNVKFSSVAGYIDIKQELVEIVDFLKQPAKYAMVGARTPKGVLLSGPPGTGKTLFAKAVAGEVGIPFYSITGSDFVEMFVGVGASRVRSLFDVAKTTAPSLIFIDELDAVGRMRGAGVGGGNDEREQTLNQLLVELDGFSQNSGIIVIAATNRPDVLDPALKRSGRFDRAIELRLPDFEERKSIFEIYAKKGRKKFTNDIDWGNIASRTPGFSGAQIENVMNEAAILSVRTKSESITLDIIDESIDRVIGGPSKVNNTMSFEEKELIAYHEAGHAIIGLVIPDAEKVQKISIVPRGAAGGYVLMTPKKEKIIQTKSELLAKITSFMGGRASEELFFGKDSITTGAYSDIESATHIARRMVAEFGMSELGPIQYEKPQGSVFLGKELASEKHSSSKIQYEIDQQIRNIINKEYQKAIGVITKNKPLIKLFAEALILKETLNAEETEFIYKTEKLPNHIEKIKEELNKKAKPSSKKPNKEESNNSKEDESSSDN